MLLRLGADPNLPNPKGTTPFMYAKSSYLDGRGDGMMRVLLSAGANPWARDMHGLTTLEYVPDARKYEVERVIAEHGIARGRS